jgi:uncharacterized protein (TIGR00251 family)
MLCYAVIMTETSYIKPTQQGCMVYIHLTPGAKRCALGETTQDAQGRVYLKVYITARPVEGEANKMLRAWLADTLGVAKSRVNIVQGLQSRHKQVVVGLQADEVAVKLPAVPSQQMGLF